MDNSRNSRVFIFSAAKAYLDDAVNVQRDDKGREWLDSLGIPYQSAIGFCDGAVERAFVVTGAEHGPAVFAFAEIFDQDSVLVVSESDRTAYFAHRLHDLHVHVGRFREWRSYNPQEDLCVALDRAGFDGATIVGDVVYVIHKTKGPDLPHGL